MDGEACGTSQALGCWRSVDAKNAVRHALDGQRKMQMLRSRENRKAHIISLVVKRNRIPHEVRTCEMKARPSKEDWKWHRGLGIVSNMCWELCKQQALEAALGFGDNKILGQNGRRLSQS